MIARSHPRQAERLKALHRLGILDTPREDSFDDIVRFVAKFCNTPVSVINFIDAERQWFKAEVGLGVRETPLDTSMCAHVILQDDFVEIPDTLIDKRTSSNPLCTASPGLRFYAGALLKSEGNLPLGTLCVLDYVPRRLSSLQVEMISLLAVQVMKQVALQKLVKFQEMQNREIDHRVTNSLMVASGFVRMQQRRQTENAVKSALEVTANRLDTIALLHRELCESASMEDISLSQYFDRLAGLLQESAPSNITITCAIDVARVFSKQASLLGIIFNEFVSNSIKHAFPDERQGLVDISSKQLGDGSYEFTMRDNGVGYEEAHLAASNGIGITVIESTLQQLNSNHKLLSTNEGVILQFEIQL